MIFSIRWKRNVLKEFDVSKTAWDFPRLAVLPTFPISRFKTHEGKWESRGKDVIDDSVNNGSGSQPIDIINDHLPELQWLRSIIRNADVVGRLLSRSIRLPFAPDHSCCRFFFRPNPSPPQRHRLRVIPAWAGISFFHPPAWRFAKIHSSPASEGAKGTPQKPVRRMRKEHARKRAEANQGGEKVVIATARMRGAG